ncbi:hypothetical protein [Hyphococcus sp.]|uniref:hypothetical protein n=1 Tax=Hyphococcus sp. TaxID=2038636 RepID=UPI0035C66A57
MKKSSRKNRSKKKRNNSQPKQGTKKHTPKAQHAIWERLLLLHLPDVSHRIGGWTLRIGVFAVFLTALSIYVSTDRAEVQITDARFPGGKLAPMMMLKIETKVENAGTESANIVKSIMRDHYSVAGNNPLPARPDYSDIDMWDEWRGTLLPGSFDGGLYTPTDRKTGLPMTFSPEQFARLNSGEDRYWVYGYIRYRDRFSLPLTSRKTGFCFTYYPTTKGLIDCGREGAEYMYMK